MKIFTDEVVGKNLAENHAGFCSHVGVQSHTNHLVTMQ